MIVKNTASFIPNIPTFVHKSYPTLGESFQLFKMLKVSLLVHDLCTSIAEPSCNAEFYAATQALQHTVQSSLVGN
jgi:hypothetical protein